MTNEQSVTPRLWYLVRPMKGRASLLACIVIAAVMLGYRCYYSDIGGAGKALMVTRWDAFGYYLYLPATCIYGDYRKLAWAEAKDAQYGLGGNGLPVVPLDNGNRVCKYLCGVAIMQAPLFAIAHAAAGVSGYTQDGFSPPYQYAIAFGAVLYCILALFLLRRILLRFFSDHTTAATLLLLCLASNFLQYAAVTSALSHSWIFVLYVLLLYATIKWHEAPKRLWAGLAGFLVGFATICRPTEAVALFIPLLWGLHTKESARSKWQMVQEHPAHVALALAGGLIGVLPQLLYWKAVTGSFVYDVGSKWVFFNPWWRVLVGWEKGWLIYTPVAALFLLGLCFIRRHPFYKAVLVFCLLNIWIVISWDDWRYGGSYSARALVQSYPVMALALGALVERVLRSDWRWAFCAAGVYLIGVNLFQIVQYNSTVLHYNDMNRRYYGRIYLNAAPTPLDMSLLDDPDFLEREEGFTKTILYRAEGMHLSGADSFSRVQMALPLSVAWLRIEATIRAPEIRWNGRLAARIEQQDKAKEVSIRLQNPVAAQTDRYAFYMEVPGGMRGANLTLSLRAPGSLEGEARQIMITGLEKSVGH